MECLALLKLDFQSHDNPQLEIEEVACGKLSIPRESLMSISVAEGILNKVFEYYSGKSIYGYTKKDFKDIAGWMYTVLSYGKGVFDPRNRKVQDVEKRFDITVDKAWAKYIYDGVEGQLAIKGTIDFITKIDNNTIEIIDWKTGKRYDWAAGEEKTYEKLCKDQQLMLYYWAAKKLYPEVENIIVTIYFIADGGPFTIAFDAEHIKKTEENLQKAFVRIRNNNMPKMVSYTQSSFKCTKLCDYFKNAHPDSKDGTNTCKFIHNELKRIGMEATTKKYSVKGHNVSNYQCPGE